MITLETAQQELHAMQARLQAAGLQHRDPPLAPTTCCGRGCNGCVWEGYFAAVSYWLEQAAQLLQASSPSGT